jgi:hypothetical protein
MERPGLGLRVDVEQLCGINCFSKRKVGLIRSDNPSEEKNNYRDASKQSKQRRILGPSNGYFIRDGPRCWDCLAQFSESAK